MMAWLFDGELYKESSVRMDKSHITAMPCMHILHIMQYRPRPIIHGWLLASRPKPLSRLIAKYIHPSRTDGYILTTVTIMLWQESSSKRAGCLWSVALISSWRFGQPLRLMYQADIYLNRGVHHATCRPLQQYSLLNQTCIYSLLYAYFCVARACNARMIDTCLNKVL
jgi:hypothetical protein